MFDRLNDLRVSHTIRNVKCIENLLFACIHHHGDLLLLKLTRAHRGDNLLLDFQLFCLKHPEVLQAFFAAQEGLFSFTTFFLALINFINGFFGSCLQLFLKTRNLLVCGGVLAPLLEGDLQFHNQLFSAVDHLGHEELVVLTL